eukprot:9931197-Prorocentrum_lima.AAC.1
MAPIEEFWPSMGVVPSGSTLRWRPLSWTFREPWQRSQAYLTVAHSCAALFLFMVRYQLSPPSTSGCQFAC